MRVSSNELAALVRRAALGVGWSDPLAGEAGLAAAELCALGGDGASAALEACAAPPRAAHLAIQAGGWRLDDAPIVAVGPSVFELLETQPEARVWLATPALPRLLLGYAARAAARFGCAYLLQGRDGTLDLPSAHSLTQIARFTGPYHVTRRPCEPGPLPAQQAPIVQHHVWAALSKLAVRSYVPSSAHSRRAGAGAGLNDSD